MKLAEALTQRAELSRKIQDQRERIIRNAQHQEGDDPAEDPYGLIEEYEASIEEFTALVIAINKTNQSTALSTGLSLIDALAQRDTLKLKHSLYKSLAADATPKQDRYSKSEIKFVSSVNVRDIQKKADAISQTYRELDSKIQEANWLNNLVK